eukprot:s4585_g2.t1
MCQTCQIHEEFRSNLELSEDFEGSVESFEVRLSKHFESAIERMNRELPPEHRILYRPFDMKNHAKSNSAIDEVFSRLAESVVSRVVNLACCETV